MTLDLLPIYAANNGSGLTGCKVAEDSLDTQRKCRFFEQASYENRCMYLKFGEYCDCRKAQEVAKS
jgi:hypothetical protein